MKLLGGRINIPWVHAYPADHPKNESGRFKVSFGRPPQRPGLAEANLPPRSKTPLPSTAGTTPPTPGSAQSSAGWNSIESLLVLPQADGPAAAPLAPGAVRQLSETNPASSSLELALMKRSAEGDRQVCEVRMRQIVTIDVAPGEPKQLFTFGLGGCIAVSLLTKQPDGRIRATMSHRPPEELQDQLNELAEAARRHRPAGETSEHEVLVLAPGGYVESGGKVELAAAATKEVGDIVQLLAERLPGCVPTLLTYHPTRERSKSDAVVIDFPSERAAPVLYKGIHNAPSGL